MKILFVCTGNSGRSLMAECFFNKHSTKDRASSAGWRADEKIHPDTVILMKELDIDISKYKPRMLSEEDMKEASRIIAINTNAYNHIPNKHRYKTENWELPILMDKSFDEVREIRNIIEIKVKELIKKLDSAS